MSLTSTGWVCTMESCAWSAWTMTGRSWRGGGTTASIKTRVGILKKKKHLGKSQTSAHNIWTDASSLHPHTHRRHGLVQRACDVLGAVHRPEGVCRQPAGERSARGPAGAGRHLRLHRSGSAAPDTQSEHTGTGRGILRFSVVISHRDSTKRAVPLQLAMFACTWTQRFLVDVKRYNRGRLPHHTKLKQTYGFQSADVNVPLISLQKWTFWCLEITLCLAGKAASGEGVQRSHLNGNRAKARWGTNYGLLHLHLSTYLHDKVRKRNNKHGRVISCCATTGCDCSKVASAVLTHWQMAELLHHGLKALQVRPAVTTNMKHH